MVRFLILTLVCTISFASSARETAALFMGKEAYESQRNLVSILFKDDRDFEDFEDGSIDLVKVLETLKDNGLLQLFFPETKSIEITFKANERPLLFLRVINESLQAMGYNYYLTKSISKDSSEILWKIGITTQHLVDPIIFAKQVQARGAKVVKIEREDEASWVYRIDTHGAKPQVSQFEHDVDIDLNKPIKPYWIDVSNASVMILLAKPADRWFPQIVFFDEALQIIEDVRMEDFKSRIQLTIPEHALFAKVEDRYSLDNIKRGLTLYLKSR